MAQDDAKDSAQESTQESSQESSLPHSKDGGSESMAGSATPENASSAETPSVPAWDEMAAKADTTEATIINLPAALVIDPAERVGAPDHDPEPGWTDPAEEPPRQSWLRRHAALAASIAVALGLGVIAGGAATSAFLHRAAPPEPVATASTRALQQSLARLESEVASVKAGIAATQRNVGTQFGKLTERIDRAEKAQAEPGQKLAKIIESLDRVEHKMPQAGALPPPASRADITGSVAAKAAPKPETAADAKMQGKAETRPPVAEGWHLLDVYAGRAVVESRNGRLFEVGPGSNLPELGRVEGIKRENGRVMVVTRNGIIVAAAASRRLPRFLYDD